MNENELNWRETVKIPENVARLDAHVTDEGSIEINICAKNREALRSLMDCVVEELSKY